MSVIPPYLYFGLYVYFWTTSNNIFCYNLEDKLPLFKFGKDGSSFGFSVAQHRLTIDKTAGVNATLLVVGAPTARVLPSLQGSSRYTRPGGVYYCPVSTNPNDCERVQLDTTDEAPPVRGAEINKSGQWLGVSLRSQGPGELLVTCAHRYRWHITSVSQPHKEEEYVCGKCFLMKGTSSGKVMEVAESDEMLTKDFISSPCEFLDDKGYKIVSKRRYGYTQAGASLAISDSEYLLGGPGAWRWSGALFAIEMPQFEQERDEPIPRLLAEAPNFYQSMTCPTSEWISHPQKPKCNEFPLNRDSYMGFSVAMSDSILPNSSETFYIAGAPRGNQSGAVVFLRKDEGRQDTEALRPDEENIIVGDAIYSSFGYSIATVDINGDGLDDLIVGAPQYYKHSLRDKIGGAVYVYINKAGVGFRHVKPQLLYGRKDSNFGHTIASLGDIDQDGYGDFAVGAPYQSSGVVHIYRGAADGIVRKSQTIAGKDYAYVKKLSQRSLSGFGSSLSGLVDADGNKYPDLLIGSLSDHVALIRARPIIGVHMKFKLDRKEIDLDAKDCDDAWSCFEITYCFEYSARHREYNGAVQLSYTITLDSIEQNENKAARVVLETPSGSSVIKSNVTLTSAGVEICPGNMSKALFLDHMDDHLSAIGVKIEYDLVIPEVKREEIGEPVFDMIKDPILDADFKKTSMKIVTIKNFCGTDGCQSDLKINATMPDEIVLGQTNNLPVRVTITNDKEEAHQARFTLTIPQHVAYSNVSTLTSRNISCAHLESDLLECKFGNPFKTGEKIEIVVNFDVTGLDWKKTEVQLRLNGYTTSDNPEIAPIVMNAKIVLELKIIVRGYGYPQQVLYKQREILGETGMNKTGDIGSLITYTFDVTNNGTYTAPGMTVGIEMPNEIYNGKWLLYLVAAEVTSSDGNTTAGSCNDTDGHVNVLRLPPSYAGQSRSKRAAKFQTMISAGSTKPVQTILSCGNGADCINITCVLEELPPSETLSVKLYTRLWETTFLEEKTLRELDLVHIETRSRLSTSFENVRLNTNITEIRTTVDHDFFKDDIVAAFPWWYILIAVVVLLLIYMLIILILIRCGFFKRKRYSRRNRENEGTTQQQEVL